MDMAVTSVIHSNWGIQTTSAPTVRKRSRVWFDESADKSSNEPPQKKPNISGNLASEPMYPVPVAKVDPDVNIFRHTYTNIAQPQLNDVPGITKQSSNETNAKPETIESRPRFQALLVSSTSTKSPNNLQPRPKPIPRPLNMHLSGNGQVINNLRQKSTEALIGIIYQSKFYYRQKECEFKTRIGQIETSHQKHVTQLLNQLRNAMEVNAELRGQIKISTECATELEEVKKQNAYQKSLLDDRQSILDQIGVFIAESQRTEELLRNELENSKIEIAGLHTKLLDKEFQLEQLRGEHSAELKLQTEIGVAVAVQVVDDRGTITSGSVRRLTPALLTQIKSIKQKFSKRSKFKISKIEYIFNNKLFNEFDSARQELAKTGRPSDEEILFHGTPPHNVNAIITGGFLIGGVNGHNSNNGAAYGFGVYCSSNSKTALGYNKDWNAKAGTRRLIALRALPGISSDKSLQGNGHPGDIGDVRFDSYSAADVYLILRTCQTLPCFIIHY